MSVTGKRMRKNPHGWMLAAVLLLAAAGLLAVHSHQTAAVPPEEPAQEEPPVMVIPAEPALPEDPVEEEPAPEEPWRPVAESAPVDDSYGRAKMGKGSLWQRPWPPQTAERST